MPKYGRVNGEGETEVILIAGVIAAGYFLVVRPIMSALGEDPADKAAIDEQTTTDPSENAFSSQFEPFVNNFNANPSYNADGSLMDLATYYQTIKQLFDNNDSSLSPALKLIAGSAEGIVDGLSFWNWAGPHVDEILAIFAQLTSKQQVASISSYLLYNYQKDLLHFLLYGGGILPTIRNGLSPSQLAILIQQINNLPNE